MTLPETQKSATKTGTPQEMVHNEIVLQFTFVMFIPILYLGRWIISINLVQMDWTHQDNEHELAYLVCSGGWENHLLLYQQMILKALIETWWTHQDPSRVWMTHVEALDPTWNIPHRNRGIWDALTQKQTARASFSTFF